MMLIIAEFHFVKFFLVLVQQGVLVEFLLLNIWSMFFHLILTVHNKSNSGGKKASCTTNRMLCWIGVLQSE